MNSLTNPTNTQISQLLRAVAVSYQIQNEAKNRFRIIAYNRAADAVEHLGSELKDVYDEGGLADIAGIGESIAAHLSEIFKTGKSAHFEEVMKGIPKAALELMNLSTIGPKKAYRLAKELSLPDKNTIAALRKHAENGDVSRLSGFGPNSQKDIMTAINEYETKPPTRMLLSEAEARASSIIEWMNRLSTIKRIDRLGSLRRNTPTVGDIDMAVSTNNSEKTIQHFLAFPQKARVINSGDKSASLLLPGNVRADLKIETPGKYGALLQHFTGSKHHNIALREHALKKGMSLSEHGIRLLNNKTQKIKEISNEVDFYNELGLEYIPPELREGTDEIELAKLKKIPKLVEINNIKGDLHMHSDFDIETSHDIGDSKMEEMLDKAETLGYEYIAFTEHNPSQKNHSQDQIYTIIKRKKEYIEQLNSSVKRKVKAFNSLEIDILPDGTLPLGNKTLDLLDFALVSIHSSFKKPKEEMTKRVLHALSMPKVKIFAHPTARILNRREGVELDWEEIFDFCLKNDKWIEINADPHRLDLPDFIVREAVRAGVSLTLGTDAHHKDGMDNMRYGVAMAKRGWCEPKNIINTKHLQDFMKVLE